MQFIISTENDCFTYDLNKKLKVKQIKRGTEGKRWAYGISWWGDRLYIAWRSPHEIVEYDRKLKPTGRVCKVPKSPAVIGDLHQITCYDKKIWCASTGTNSIVTFDCGTLDYIESWKPHEGVADDDGPYNPPKGKPRYTEDYKHYNSIMFRSGRIYINAHMTTHNPPSNVWVFTYPGLKFIKKVEGGESSHNIFFIGDELTICDSGNGRLIQPEKYLEIFRGGIGSFLRGISQPPGKLIIGRADKCIKADRPKARGGLVIIHDRKFKSPDPRWLGYGPIEEIRCLDEEDLAHPVPEPFWGSGVAT